MSGADLHALDTIGGGADLFESQFIIRLRPTVCEASMSQNGMRIRLRSWDAPKDVPFPFGAGAALLPLLAFPGVALQSLRGHAEECDGGWRAIAAALENLAQKRLLSWAYGDPDHPLLCIEPLSGRFIPDYDAFSAGPRQLSRFAYVRRHDNELVIESAEVAVRIAVTPRGGPLLEGLLRPERAQTGPSQALARMMACCGLLEPLGEEPTSRRTWEFADRLFHEASRNNVSGRTIGATYRFRSVFASEPAVRHTAGETHIPLPPHSEGPSEPLRTVMERRVSRRGPGSRSLQLQELADVLWRVARVRAVLRYELQELLSRPIPAGGSIHELEFYVAIHHCSGLDPGLYRYAGVDHALVPVTASPRLVGQILDQAVLAQGLPPGLRPDCIVTLAARQPRISWKYQGVAYRVALLNAGVAIGALYLVCTDLGLSACALGTGNSSLLQKATGFDTWQETAIAEFSISGAGPISPVAEDQALV